jgi:protocatechuate 3,4-dioxygenase, alpha subunit
MSRPLTPSQTIGPFFHRALLHEGWDDLAARGAAGERIVIEGRVLDGDGAPVSDAMIETWQANAAGRYDHPEDYQESDRQETHRREKPLDSNFHGFGRTATGPDGSFRLRTIKPGSVRSVRPVPGGGDATQAPHINLSILARGLLKRLVTRIYFPVEPLNGADPLLSTLPASGRATLIARAGRAGAAERVLHFDIVLQGDNETVFLDV